MDWDTLTETVAACQACGLCHSRRNTVFGVGDRQADWLVVGEAPGEMEDLQGEPFVGPAGQLLDNMLRAIGLGRHENVYLTNVLKCRPPANRNPEPAEVAQCEPYLRRQVALLQPKIILAMGRFAVQSLLGSTEPIGKLRGQIHHYAGVPVVVTYTRPTCFATCPIRPRPGPICAWRWTRSNPPANERASALRAAGPRHVPRQRLDLLLGQLVTVGGHLTDAIAQGLGHARRIGLELVEAGADGPFRPGVFQRVAQRTRRHGRLLEQRTTRGQGVGVGRRGRERRRQQNERQGVSLPKPHAAVTFTAWSAQLLLL
jgi:DNA polymerase